MNNQAIKLDNPFGLDAAQQSGPGVDFKRVFYRALKFWYVVVLVLVIALGIAHLKNRYAIRIYPVSASILVKESKESSEGKLLYNNPLVSPYRNYFNELYILQSYPIIESVLKDLNFEVSFFREGNFMTTEAYDYLPIEAAVVGNPDVRSKKLILKLLDENRLQLMLNGGASDKEEKIFSYGDTIQYAGLTMVFNKKGQRDIEEYDGQSFIFLFTKPSALTGPYLKRLNIEWAQEGAGIINISMSGPNPAKDIDFINGLIRRYQEYDLEKKNLAANRAIDFIQAQLDNIGDSLHKVESQLEHFKTNSMATNLDRDAERLYDKLELLDVNKAELQLKENYYDYLIDYIKKSGDLDQVIMPSSVGIGDGILTGLVSKMIDIQMEMKLYLNQGKGDNPVIAEKRRRLDMLKQSIIESVQNQVATEKIQLEYYNTQIRDIEKQLGHIPVEQRQYVSIQRNYSLLDNLYIYLMQKRAEADISRASTTSDIQIVNPPMAGGAIAPKPSQNYFIGLALGLLLPFAAFFLIELFNTKVQSKEDIAKLTQIPFIGGVGHKKTTDNKVILSNPKSSVAESFRALRSNLAYFIGNKEKALFLVTSSISGEGKTFTTINLATVLSLSGKKTLIVGADLRKPKLFHDFDLNNTRGLSNYLAGQCTYAETVQHTSQNCLDLVSGGPIPPNPSELLLNPRMDEFMRESTERYDYVIIDSPPLGIVTDAHVLTKYADHTLFIVRQNYTPRNFLKTIQEYYESGRVTKVSILLNDIYKSGPGYGYGTGYGYGYTYGYGNGYGYGYYEDEPDKRGVISKFFSRKGKNS